MSKTLSLLCLLLFSTVCLAQTKSDTFTFGSLSYPSACANAQFNNGTVGEVCVNLYDNPYSGMEFPQSLGFPNNGFCLDNAPFAWGEVVYLNGGGPNIAGSVDYQSGSAAYGGYCFGVTVSVTVFYQVHKHLGRFGHVYYTNDETNGTGTSSYEP